MPFAEPPMRGQDFVRSRIGVDLETLRRIGPVPIDDGPPGVPRSRLTVPISPTGRVDDTVMFQDPADATRSYYLPRYRLQIGEFSGQYQITTEFVDGRWRMTFDLESFPAPEIEQTLGGAAILPHGLTVTVTSGGQLQREYPVAEFAPGVDVVRVRPRVVLSLTLPERDALLRAFTLDEDQARIVVHRTVTVAVPAARRRPRPTLAEVVEQDLLNRHLILPDLVVDPSGGVPFPDPVDVVKHHVGGGERFGVHTDAVGGDEVAAVTTLGSTHDGGPGVHIVTDHLSGQGPVAGFRQRLVVDRAFTVHGSALSFATPQAPQAPQAAALLATHVSTTAEGALRLGADDRLLLENGFRPIVVDDPGPRRIPGDDGIPVDDVPDVPDGPPVPDGPDGPPAEPEPRFTVVTTAADVTVPLRFDVDAHPYLFPSGQPPAAPGFRTFVVPWPAEGPASRNHVYFLDAAGEVFYHLPDVFLIGRRDQPPYGPELSFTVGRTTDTGSGTERALALVSAHLVPQTSSARLRDAATVLAAELPAGTTEVRLRPAVHPATCTLQLPGGAVTTGAPPDLVSGWWIAESFGFDDLRDVYAVLTTGATSALLRGRVDVDVLGETHQVPVELRLDRPAAAPLSWTGKAGPEAGSVTVTLHNESDTTLQVPAPPAWLDAGADAVAAVVTGPLPARLEPGRSLELTLSAGSPPAGPGPLEAALDLTGVRIVVTAEQAVEQTLDRRVERLPRPVTLVTTPGAFAGSGDPERDVVLIGVQFDGVTGAALLDGGHLQLDLAVPVPLRDWLLDRGLGSFRYRQTIVHASSSSSADTTWRSTDSNLLPLPQPIQPA